MRFNFNPRYEMPQRPSCQNFCMTNSVQDPTLNDPWTDLEPKERLKFISLNIGWVLLVPVLLIAVSASWTAITPLVGQPDGPIAWFAPLLLIGALSAGAYWSSSPDFPLSRMAYWIGVLLSMLVGLYTPLLSGTVTIIALAPSFGALNRDAVALGLSLASSALALFTGFIAVAVSAVLYFISERRKWSALHTGRRMLLANTAVLVIGTAALISSSAFFQLSGAPAPQLTLPVTEPSPTQSSTPSPTATPTPSGLATLPDPSCPAMRNGDITPLRIPKGNATELVSSVLTMYGAWLNAGSEILKRPEWKNASPRCLNQLAQAYQDAYAIDFTDAGIAANKYFVDQPQLTLQTLTAINQQAAGTPAPIPSRYELLKIIDSNTYPSTVSLKFDAVLKPTIGGYWQGLDKTTRWYLDLVRYQDGFVISHIQRI